MNECLLFQETCSYTRTASERLMPNDSVKKLGRVLL